MVQLDVMAWNWMVK